MSTDRILTVNNYYDGPRLGVAEYNGVPHIYEAEFDHSTEEYGDTYFLSPIEPQLLDLVLEDWAIWLRWQAAHARGEAGLDSHPALPAEQERHEELKVLIGDQLRVEPKSRLYCAAEFKALEAGVLSVQWKRL